MLFLVRMEESNREIKSWREEEKKIKYKTETHHAFYYYDSAVCVCAQYVDSFEFFGQWKRSSENSMKWSQSKNISNVLFNGKMPTENNVARMRLILNLNTAFAMKRLRYTGSSVWSALCCFFVAASFSSRRGHNHGKRNCTDLNSMDLALIR